MNDICLQFVEWLDNHDFEFTIESGMVVNDEFLKYADGCRVIVFPSVGHYFRISDFDHREWYVRENGLCYSVSPFELCDKLLEEKQNGRKLEDRRLRELVSELRVLGTT